MPTNALAMVEPTPEPWEVNIYVDDNPPDIVAHGHYLAHLHGNNTKRTRADAYLMAAAPQMLAALEAVAGRAPGAIKLVRAAIATARCEIWPPLKKYKDDGIY